VGYLYKGSRVSGHLSFQGSATIDGTVDGDIQCQGTLTIGESAEVKAKITAQAVIVRGKVEGNVTAKERIELIAPARLIGDIETSRLFFEGVCSMGVAKQKGGVAVSHGAIADIAAGAQSAKANS
jgi:cytoskeletal protein CcmA (bactofilin family)